MKNYVKGELFRSYLEKEENQKIGERLRKARKDKHLSQDALVFHIEDFIEKDLQKRGFSMMEIEHYFERKLTEAERKHFKKQGIEPFYKRIAISTISNYENGSAKIPFSYISLVQKVLGDIKF